MMKRNVLLSALVLVGLSTLAMPAHASGLVLEPCHVRGHAEQIECGYLTVPEDHLNPTDETLDIYVVRLPAISSGKSPDPLVFLAGGPGQAATELTAFIASIFSEVRQTRDILLIDQRGTGKSNPLQCDLQDLDLLLLSEEEIDLTAAAQTCADALDVNFQHYHTVNAIHDFDAVRRALGYQQINLYGGSYGTRAGLVWMREKPEAIRAVVLDGLAPTQVVVGPFGTFSQRAYERLVADCAADTACHERFGDVDANYQALRQALREQPPVLQYRDPRSDEIVELLLTEPRLSGTLRNALYSPRTRQLIPLVMDATARGDYRPLIGLFNSMDAENPMYLGLTLSVLCQEDMPRVDETLLTRDRENIFMGGQLTDDFMSLCAGWPVNSGDPQWAEPVYSELPVLLLSGEQDPVTPPEWAELAAETLPNSRHIVAEHGGHTIVSHTCANRLVAQFLDRPGAELDASCIDRTRLLPFVRNVNAAGM
ncbi:alpha/beta hydrolase [Aliidiomarina sanyensis]|uniref:Alpha/beta hydrolase n=1 Tax=Aliidiomarina sanyensis TaxID=1249555 RepID=A0A432WIA2_9GAMM|nr:alpha/beta hydrolase [Aliidiomarina sanyensis]RUO33534.1 alpha/beta hydrolase [Aliidiomarina sanyensis]